MDAYSHHFQHGAEQQPALNTPPSMTGSQHIGHTTALQSASLQPFGLPSNATENEKFPDFCLHQEPVVVDNDDEHHNYYDPSAHSDPHLVNDQHHHQFVSSSIIHSAVAKTIQDPATVRALRTSSIISSAPSEASISISETSTRAASPTPTYDYTASPNSSPASSQKGSPELHSAPKFASPTPSIPRSRRTKKELNAARVQRSGSYGSQQAPTKDKETTPSKRRRFLSSATGQVGALAAVEPAHEQVLTRMAFAEQQRWITVQQKTFTKWWVPNNNPLNLPRGVLDPRNT